MNDIILLKNNKKHFIINKKQGDNMMDDKKRVPGSTTVAPDVIETIIQMTANDTPGVSRIFNSNSANSGVKLKIAEGTVSADIYIALCSDCNTLAVCNKLQKKIERAIKDMVGMKVGSLNIHIEDFDYSEMN